MMYFFIYALALELHAVFWRLIFYTLQFQFMQWKHFQERFIIEGFFLKCVVLHKKLQNEKKFAKYDNTSSKVYKKYFSLYVNVAGVGHICYYYF